MGPLPGFLEGAVQAKIHEASLSSSQSVPAEEHIVSK